MLPHLLPSFSRIYGQLAVLWLILIGSAAGAQESYRIQPGDVLSIEVIEDETLNRSVLVSPDGRITVPLAGSIMAGGRTLGSIQSTLTEQLAPSFVDEPQVFVSLERLAPPVPPAPPAPVVPPAPPPMIDVHVLGEVGNPGLIEVAPGTNVLQLFAQMGGFTPFAATRRIQLRRLEHGAERIYNLNYDAILEGRSPNGRARIVEGDVIIVPERKLFE